MTVVVVMYDISTTSAGGRKRLRRVSNICGKWGTPVQNSVYECLLDAERFKTMREELDASINHNTDSVRFYQLGKHYASRISSIGKTRYTWDADTFVV